MYNGASQLPAPYTLANPMSTQAQALAKGGRAKGGMTPAHFNRKELDILDHLQGGRKDHHGFRSYDGLEKVLSNPHVSENVHHHIRKRHAAGGTASYTPMQMNHMASEGRNGDTEMAYIGPHLHGLLNRFAGGPTHNPETGKPEYFSLGGMLGGLWDGIKGVGNTVWNGVKGVLPTLGQLGGTALGGYLGGPMGAGIGSSLGGSLGGALSHIGGDDEQSPQQQGVSQSIGSGLNSYLGGASPSQAFGQAAQGIGSQFGGSGFGQAMQGFGNSLSNGQGFGQAARQGASQGFQGMGGMQGLSNMANGVMSGARNGMQGGGFQGSMQGGLNAARGAFGDAGRQFMPSYQGGRPQQSQDQYQGQGYGQSQYPGQQQAPMYGPSRQTFEQYGRPQRNQMQDNYQNEQQYGDQYGQGGY